MDFDTVVNWDVESMPKSSKSDKDNSNCCGGKLFEDDPGTQVQSYKDLKQRLKELQIEKPFLYKPNPLRYKYMFLWLTWEYKNKDYILDGFLDYAKSHPNIIAKIFIPLIYDENIYYRMQKNIDIYKKANSNKRYLFANANLAE